MAYRSVVRVYATRQEPDYDSPWQSQTPANGTGSGVVIGDGLVLTGAHVVTNATFVRVQKVDEPNKHIGRVRSICHDCDLALLSIDDGEAFMRGVTPASLGELPDLRDRVQVVGYPVGGEEISITEGVVSRIEVQRYRHSERGLLAVTVDAAINRGNSGGPVFRDGKVCGIAFQTLSNAENIGELVPAPIIKRFLEGTERGLDLAIPSLGLRTQSLENPNLRKRLGLAPDDGGILVASVDHGVTSSGVIEPGDVLLVADGLPIASNGSVRYAGRYRTHWNVVLADHFVGETLPVTVLRKKRRLDLDLELMPMRRLVPLWQHERPPTYFIYAGLVFQTLGLDFLATWNRWWERAPKEFLHHYYSGVATAGRREVVVLTQVLADEINVGYDALYDESVVEINGEPVRDMADFVARVEASNGTVEIRTSRAGLIVLDTDLVADANARVLARYNISSDRSADLASARTETGRAGRRERTRRPVKKKTKRRAAQGKKRAPRRGAAATRAAKSG